MQIPCVYLPGPAPAVSVANIYFSEKNHFLMLCRCYFLRDFANLYIRVTIGNLREVNL
jgi:hypothetical protein